MVCNSRWAEPSLAADVLTFWADNEGEGDRGLGLMGARSKYACPVETRAALNSLGARSDASDLQAASTNAMEVSQTRFPSQILN